MKASAKAEALEALLLEAGLPPVDPATLDEDVRAIFERGGPSVRGVLASRGWVVHFDAEGDFVQSGAHADVVESLLRAGQVVVEDVRDEWLGDVGWSLTIVERPGAAPRMFGRRAVPSEPDPDGSPSDWADLPLIATVARVFLETIGRELIDLRSGDQTVLLAVVPGDVWSRAREGKLVSGRPIRSDKSVCELDANSAKDLARRSHLRVARGYLNHHAWQFREQACTDKTLAALRSDCSLSQDIAKAASEDPFHRIRDWAARARSAMEKS
jgi:hypothetical protein